MKCSIKECDNELSPRSKLRICALCRATICRWEYRRVSEVLHRMTQLVRYSSRMDEVTGGKRKRK